MNRQSWFQVLSEELQGGIPQPGAAGLNVGPVDGFAKNAGNFFRRRGQGKQPLFQSEAREQGGEAGLPAGSVTQRDERSVEQDGEDRPVERIGDDGLRVHECAQPALRCGINIGLIFLTPLTNYGWHHLEGVPTGVGADVLQEPALGRRAVQDVTEEVAGGGWRAGGELFIVRRVEQHRGVEHLDGVFPPEPPAEADTAGFADGNGGEAAEQAAATDGLSPGVFPFICAERGGIGHPWCGVVRSEEVQEVIGQAGRIDGAPNLVAAYDVSLDAEPAAFVTQGARGSQITGARTDVLCEELMSEA